MPWYSYCSVRLLWSQNSILISLFCLTGFPGSLLPSSKEPACQCKRQKKHGFDPWISAGSQREELHPWQRSRGRRLRHTQRRDRASGNPCSPASSLKTRVCLLYCFMLSPTPLTLRGADPHHLFQRRS